MKLFPRIRCLFSTQPSVLLDRHDQVSMTLKAMPSIVHSSLLSRVPMYPNSRSLAVVARVCRAPTAFIRTEGVHAGVYVTRLGWGYPLTITCGIISKKSKEEPVHIPWK
jgi:hypothetical protein